MEEFSRDIQFFNSAFLIKKKVHFWFWVFNLIFIYLHVCMCTCVCVHDPVSRCTCEVTCETSLWRQHSFHLGFWILNSCHQVCMARAFTNWASQLSDENFPVTMILPIWLASQIWICTCNVGASNLFIGYWKSMCGLDRKEGKAYTDNLPAL